MDSDYAALRVFNPIGQILQETQLSVDANVYTIDLTALSQGIYIVEIETESGIVHHAKIFKSK